MIRIEGLTLRAGAFELADINLQIPAGCYAVLMGPTGCGKTSIIEAICGLRKPAAGRILLGDRDVTRLRPAERNVGYVPQDGAVFPIMTVADNLAFALRLRGWSKAKRRARAEQMAAMLGITHLLDRMPEGLSGGEAQRVALGRALAFEPDVLCLDEPLSALDADTRVEMNALLHNVQRSTGVTTLHVTHDQAEAERLAHKLLRITDGQLIEQDLPARA